MRHPRGSRLAALLEYFRAFRPGVKYYVWDWRDPLPTLVGIGMRAARGLRALQHRLSGGAKPPLEIQKANTGESLNNA